MNLISAAERLASLDRSAVTFDPKQCLHASDQFSSCEACLNLCPQDAIQPGKPPAFDEKKCATCLACLPACPVNAFSADDAAAAVLNSVSRIESGMVELACKKHSHLGKGLSENHIAIQVRGCLAGLGVGALLDLAALGTNQVALRLDACENCAWSSLQAQIEAQAAFAGRILAAWGKHELVICIDSLTNGAERPVWDADNPPLSRRDLFRFASHQGQMALARSMNHEQVSGERKPARDRQRLLQGLNHLPERKASFPPETAQPGYAGITVTETCTACGVCARACPTGAIQFQQKKEELRYQLQFSARMCIGCEACAHVCAQKAVQLNLEPTFEQVFGPPEWETLQAGGLIRCERCQMLFAASPGTRYCPACEFRRKNPFGSQLPPGLDISQVSKK